MSTLPLFYFKPTICCIDDDALFLESIRINFKDQYHCVTFENVDKAMDFFNAYQAPLVNRHFKREFTESDHFGAHHHYPVDIDIPSIKNIMKMPLKKNEIAVLIIDYHMPIANGLDICKKLQSLPFKKILLTGDSLHEKTIEAFNQGLIDKFVKKDFGIADKLKAYIDELTQLYFHQKTLPLLSHIEVSKSSPLSDQRFVTFFNHWCVENKVEEFYLINKQGSFLLKHVSGELSYFIVMSEQDKIEFLNLSDELSEEAKPLLNALANGKLIPFFGAEKEFWDIDVKDWDRYFYPANVIEGREKYYWTVVKSKMMD